MYKLLSEEEVVQLTLKNLGVGRYLVSHVGDGEYSCNIFGNIYTSYFIALNAAKQVLGEKIGIYVCEGVEDVYICSTYSNTYETFRTMPAIARLTVEFVNGKFNSGL